MPNLKNQQQILPDIRSQSSNYKGFENEVSPERVEGKFRVMDEVQSYNSNVLLDHQDIKKHSKQVYTQSLKTSAGYNT